MENLRDHAVLLALAGLNRDSCAADLSPDQSAQRVAPTPAPGSLLILPRPVRGAHGLEPCLDALPEVAAHYREVGPLLDHVVVLRSCYRRAFVGLRVIYERGLVP
ncbi:MAG: hypothetical protein ACM31K_04990, partial [Solirubrobacterales bacterium]